MGIIVTEAQDSDIARATEVEFAAYGKNPTISSRILFPGPFPPDSKQQRVDGLIKDRQDDGRITYLKAVDEETGELVAFTKYIVYGTAEEAAAVEYKGNFGQGTNTEGCHAFFGGLFGKRKALFGSRPYIYLHLLHTDPNHQGKGAGSSLIKNVKEKAEKLSLPIYLESSPDAHQFYLKQGFKEVDIFILDLKPFGGEDAKHHAPLMLWEPSLN